MEKKNLAAKSLSGRKNVGVLDPDKLNYIKTLIYSRIPQKSPVELEYIWTLAELRCLNLAKHYEQKGDFKLLLCSCVFCNTCGYVELTYFSEESDNWQLFNPQQSVLIKGPILQL